MSMNGDRAKGPLENMKPSMLALGDKLLLCCLWLFSYTYKGGACLRDETLRKHKVHKMPCQKQEGP
jgi:hypothetical protein